MSAGGTLRRHLIASLAKVSVLLGVAGVLAVVVLPRLRGDYGSSAVLDARTVVWLVMKLHLMFAAFVLGVPIFAMIVEMVGAATGDDRYDRLAVLEGAAGSEGGEDEEEEDEVEGDAPASDDTGAAVAETIEVEAERSQVARIGDTIVGANIDGEFSSLCGEHIDGDAETGLTLKLLEQGQWVQRAIGPEQIDFVNLLMCPCPPTSRMR